MSQYPSPYSVPNPYVSGYAFDPFAAQLVLARRASIMMFILGSLFIGYALCNAVGAVVITPEQIQAQSSVFGSGPGMSVQTVKAAILFVSALIGIAGIGLIGLGIPVRRGVSGAIVAGIVWASMITMVVGFLMLYSLRAAMQASSFLVIAAALAVLLGFFVRMLNVLSRAAREGSQLTAQRRQLQSQYWYYVQQQQAYAQAGHGYAQAPAVTPPARNTEGSATQSGDDQSSQQ